MASYRDVVGRVREDHLGLFPAHQSPHSAAITDVPAKNAMLSQAPEITGLRDGFSGLEPRQLITRIRLTWLRLQDEINLAVVEAGHRHINIAVDLDQLGEFQGQGRFVPIQRAQPDDCPLLRKREARPGLGAADR